MAVLDRKGVLAETVALLARRHNWPGEGQTEGARLIGVTPRAMRSWLAGDRTLSGEACCLLRAMARDKTLEDALRHDYRRSRLPVPEPLDRLLFALNRDPSLAAILRK